MSGHRLSLRQTPPLRVDARALQPAALAALSLAEVAQLRLPMGRDSVAVGELFHCRALDDGGAGTGASAASASGAGLGADSAVLQLEGDLGRFDNLGLALAQGHLLVQGPVGHALGQLQTGGRINVHGSALSLAGCSLRGGWLEVQGDVGDLAASALPGDMDGMRGGTFIIHGRAGDRLGDRMRRGTLVVHGDVGDFVASRMVAGTLALGGRCGAHPGWGMRRGSLVFAGFAPWAQDGQGPREGIAGWPASVLPVQAPIDVAWRLLARSLAPLGGVFAGLAARVPQRALGDTAVQGRGEWLVAPG